jgi:hypothetical protein
VEVHIQEKQHLSKQLEAARNEVAVWVLKYAESESDRKRLLRANELLRKAKKALEVKVDSLSIKHPHSEQSHSAEVSKSVVIPFNKA